MTNTFIKSLVQVLVIASVAVLIGCGGGSHGTTCPPGTVPVGETLAPDRAADIVGDACVVPTTTDTSTATQTASQTTSVTTTDTNTSTSTTTSTVSTTDTNTSTSVTTFFKKGNTGYFVEKGLDLRVSTGMVVRVTKANPDGTFVLTTQSCVEGNCAGYDTLTGIATNGTIIVNELYADGVFPCSPDKPNMACGDLENGTFTIEMDL